MTTFQVFGVPAPQGSKTRMPNGAMLEGGSQTGRDKQRAWRTAVADTARGHVADKPLDGPLMLIIEFRMPRPKARRKAEWCDRKPDIDKLIRATCDALTDAGMIVDDSHIVSVHATKVYADLEDPWTGAHIVANEIDPQD